MVMFLRKASQGCAHDGGMPTLCHGMGLAASMPFPGKHFSCFFRIQDIWVRGFEGALLPWFGRNRHLGASLR